MLGHAQAIEDRRVLAPGGIEPGGRADRVGARTDEVGLRLGAVALLGDEAGPGFEIRRIATLAHVGLVDQAFRDDDVADGVDEGDVGAGLQRDMIIGLDVRRLHEVGRARVGDDQLGAGTQALLHARPEHGMAVGRVGADDQDDVGLLDRAEILRAGGGAERGREAVARRRVANAGAGVDVVVAEAGTHQFLNEVRLLVGAARRRHGADRVAAVLGLDALELRGGMGDRLLPGDLAPRVGDRLADHRLGHAILVGRVAIGEPSL